MPKILPSQTDLYAITDSRLSLGRPLGEVVGALLASGLKIIQYREKHLKMRQMLEECRLIRKLTFKAQACFIVDDYLELARLSQADGVHLGQEDLPIKEARSLLGPDFIIGISTHSPAQAKEAVDGGADYIGVGPVFATKTKEDVVDPVGLGYVEYIAQNTKIPFVAIGGIKAHNIKQVLDKGATCCALVSELVGARDICAKVKEVRQAMQA
ncbi:MAG: thiamine phosphate synthase [Desulfovibrio sp.]|nr:thiamine phosphate synthase [Desulfovibrio sp.]